MVSQNYNLKSRDDGIKLLCTKFEALGTTIFITKTLFVSVKNSTCFNP